MSTEAEEPIEYDLGPEPDFPVVNDPIHHNKLPEEEVMMRLKGGMRAGKWVSSGIKGYNETFAKFMPHHCVTVGKLNEMLLGWGVDADRAEKLASQYGYKKV